MWSGGISQGFEPMRGWYMMLCNAFIGQVSHRFSHGTKIWGGLSPSHWQGHQWLFTVQVRDGDTQLLGDVFRLDPDAIKTIGDVNLDKFHRAKALISFDNLCDDAFEGTAKLHGVNGGQCNGLTIYFRKL
jgi:hypothetical protein